MRYFDAYLAVDWSAQSKPSLVKPTANAIWVGEHVVAEDHTPQYTPETYFRTRHSCLNHLRQRLREHVSFGRRVFIGFDFAYGYPAGFAEACGLPGAAAPWRRVWNKLSGTICDAPSGANNRFEIASQVNHVCDGRIPGPFWGCPNGHTYHSLTPTSPPFPFELRSGPPLQAKRETEKRVRGAQSAWKLSGAGSVGGQSLVGIPAISGLRDDPEFSAISQVWPFETGFRLATAPPGNPIIFHAEIYPGVVRDRLDRSLAIVDQAQVRAVVNWLSELDRENSLLSLFSTPPGLSEGDVERAIHEEGWILGCR